MTGEKDSPEMAARAAIRRAKRPEDPVLVIGMQADARVLRLGQTIRSPWDCGRIVALWPVENDVQVGTLWEEEGGGLYWASDLYWSGSEWVVSVT